jgi:hypothetical protein
MIALAHFLLPFNLRVQAINYQDLSAIAAQGILPTDKSRKKNAFVWCNKKVSSLQPILIAPQKGKKL